MKTKKAKQSLLSYFFSTDAALGNSLVLVAFNLSPAARNKAADRIAAQRAKGHPDDYREGCISEANRRHAALKRDMNSGR